MIASIALAATSIDGNIPRRWFLYYLVSLSITQETHVYSDFIQAASHAGTAGVILSWVNELNSEDNESAFPFPTFWYRLLNNLSYVLIERAFILASCNTFAYVFQVSLSSHNGSFILTTGAMIYRLGFRCE